MRTIIFSLILKRDFFDYVVRVRDSDNSCMVSGLNLPKTEEYDITKRVVLTRHFSGPAAINTEKYKYLSKKSRFDYIENSKSPDYEITIRFVRFLLDDNTYEVIATSLPEEIFSMEDLKEIYHQRWGIETGFRELKYILGLSAFHSKQENSILQEIYARLVMYNFSMLIAQHVKPKEKDLKYRLQINFTQATKICLNFFRYKGKEPPYDIEATIQRFLLPIRPNRKRQRVSVSTCVVSFNYRLA
ncbi:MAG: transposase [Coprococcus phoceensis]